MLTFEADLIERQVTAMVAGQEIAFRVAPEDLGSTLGALNWGLKEGLWGQQQDGEPEAPQPLGNLALASYNLLRRIRGWDGLVDRQGEPLPCTEANKMAFFAQYPQVLLEIGEKMAAVQEAELKNSETSPTG